MKPDTALHPTASSLREVHPKTRRFRRVTVLVKMVRFIIGRYLGVPEAEVDKLIRQYIETTRIDFPDRPDIFPFQENH
ncbi:MAG: hypothetical protein KA419_20955 [Acidobacteria bacterium]|nr:hypothetical protein [Acidobacteriota bacterium]